MQAVSSAPVIHRLAVGETCPALDVPTLSGTRVCPPAAGERTLLHLQFRRFAGCPICNLHLADLAARWTDVQAAHIRSVAVFHSSADAMRPLTSLPMELVADPGKALYAAFGVGTSPLASLDPRIWGAALRGMRHTSLSRALDLSESHDGLPADFLIGPGGRLLALKYGTHPNDHWSVDDVLTLAAAARPS